MPVLIVALAVAYTRVSTTTIVIIISTATGATHPVDGYYAGKMSPQNNATIELLQTVLGRSSTPFENTNGSVFFSCDQVALRTLLSVRLSVCLSVCPAKKFNYTKRFIDDLHTLNNVGHLEENNNMGRIYPQELKLNQENQNDDKATFLDLEEQIKMPASKLRHMTKEMHSSLKLLIALTFLAISLPNQHMEFSHPKSFVMLGSAVRKVICPKGLRASPKNYYRNTTPSMASSHHWRNVWRNIAGSWPNWALDFTRTSQKNNRTSQKIYYQHSRNFWNFLFSLIISITQASKCTTWWSDSGCWGLTLHSCYCN